MQLTVLQLIRQALALLPGLALALAVALAATFVAGHYGGPRFLYALLLGIALHFLHGHARCHAGIEFAARRLVRMGVALLGARIAFADVGALGPWGIAALFGTVVLTMGFGLLMARLLRLPATFGLLSGGATGICGISAALAISSTLPATRENERHALMTAIGIAALSTTAMVLYPVWVKWAALPVPQAGLFLGGAIHDVAQVVGAGNIISPEVAQSATLAKMFRVALLVPVVLALALLFRRQGAAAAHAPRSAAGAALPTRRPPVLPPFLLVFVALMAANSLGWVPPAVGQAAGRASQWALVVSIAALGIKTSFEQMAALGWRPIALLVSETLFVALFMLAVVELMLL